MKAQFGTCEPEGACHASRQWLYFSSTALLPVVHWVVQTKCK